MEPYIFDLWDYETAYLDTVEVAIGSGTRTTEKDTTTVYCGLDEIYSLALQPFDISQTSTNSGFNNDLNTGKQWLGCTHIVYDGKTLTVSVGL